ncbi:MAG: hypothetical protein GX043_02530 [Desulfovibrionales bacterium]|nr:hypothetical protein [Desulfovibrionales bacterium]
MNWHSVFSQVPLVQVTKGGHLIPRFPLQDLKSLKFFLDLAHIKFCLLKPFQEIKKYPLIDARDLLPSFEPTLNEFSDLPGFSMVALHRPLDYFNETFQFDLLHSCQQPSVSNHIDRMESDLQKKNVQCFLRHLGRADREYFQSTFANQPITDLTFYTQLVHYLTHMDRAHVFSLDATSTYYLSGIYASLPSDLDTELKRFGLKVGKFLPNDNLVYENNREFVYQFLMELYGYPITSERRTSVAIFARRLHKMGERFLARGLGQSDRILTSIYSTKAGHYYPRVEKIALVPVETRGMDVLNHLESGGYFVDPKKRVVILRVAYRQHKFDPNNVRQDRALSVLRQEIIHPLTGQSCTSFNLIKDSYTMSLKLNDIVRGEFLGRTLYKGNEIVEDTDSHAKRLKFLHSWMSKHQRRMIGYSDEFYQEIAQVLDSYLTDADLDEEFAAHRDLWNEVIAKYSYIKQARKIRELEDLGQRTHKGKRINYVTMMELTTELITDLKFEFANYFKSLTDKAIFFSENILNDRYLIRTYITPAEELLTKNGQKIRKLYRRLVSLVDELKAIRKMKAEV